MLQWPAMSGLQVSVSTSSTNRAFNDDVVYEKACVPEPTFAFQWLEHHHAILEMKIRIRVAGTFEAQ